MRTVRLAKDKLISWSTERGFRSLSAVKASDLSLAWWREEPSLLGLVRSTRARKNKLKVITSGLKLIYKGSFYEFKR